MEWDAERSTLDRGPLLCSDVADGQSWQAWEPVTCAGMVGLHARGDALQDGVWHAADCNSLQPHDKHRNLDCDGRTMRGSTSTATTFLACCRSSCVRLPVPGPISNTVSVLLMPALSTMALTTFGFLRMCWPRVLWNSMPASHDAPHQNDWLSSM